MKHLACVCRLHSSRSSLLPPPLVNSMVNTARLIFSDALASGRTASRRTRDYVSREFQANRRSIISARRVAEFGKR